MIIFISRPEFRHIFGARLGIRHKTRKGITGEEKEDLRKVKGGK